MAKNPDAWPELAFEAWSDTLATLHMWTQVVGKVRLVQSPWVNHSWHVTLYVTARGLSTSPIPYGTRTFEIEFDFIAHQLAIRTSEGRALQIPLEPQSVAAFYRAADGGAESARSRRQDPREAERGRPRRSPSIRMRCTGRTIASTRPGSGACWCRRIGS